MQHPKHASETNHVKGRKWPRELYLKKGSILGLPLLGAMDARKSLEERKEGDGGSGEEMTMGKDRTEKRKG